MRTGFQFETGEDVGAAAEIRVRRCREEGELEFVELTLEASNPHWFMSCVCLTPELALKIGAALIQEGANPLEDGLAHVSSALDFRG